MCFDMDTDLVIFNFLIFNLFFCHVPGKQLQTALCAQKMFYLSIN